MKQDELFKIEEITMFDSNNKGITYKQAQRLLRQRHKVYIGHCTYLVKHKNYISLDFFRSSELMQFYPNGQVIVKFRGMPVTDMGPTIEGNRYLRTNTGFYTSWAQRDRVNKYLPYDYKFFSYRYHTMIAPIINGEMVRSQAHECPQTLIFKKKYIQYFGYRITDSYGKSITDLQNQYKLWDLAREKPRRRGRYWTQRARNLYRKPCKAKECVFWSSERPNRPTTYSCGCVTYRKNIKFNYTIPRILAEQNATVRTSMIQLYGIRKFFEAANAILIASRGDYKLLQLNIPGREGFNRMRGLKMTCPSTGQIYVNLVPEQISTVSDALNWMFQTRDYFNTVGAQT